VPGGEWNSRPTPKAFGAALLLQMVNGEGGILLPFQCSLDSPRLFQRCYLFFCYYRKFCSETLCRCCVTSEMLGEARIEINARTNVAATGCATKNVNPNHFSKVPGGRVELPTKGL
jgi:hypothetical protein